MPQTPREKSLAKLTNLAKLSADVPIFIIKGYDRLATRVISHWLYLAQQEGVNEAKIDGAIEELEDFRRYAAEHPEAMKLPD